MTDRSTHQLIETSVESTKAVKGILKKPTNYLMKARNLNRSTGGGPFIEAKKVSF